jgi:hypothetical protein
MPQHIMRDRSQRESCGIMRPILPEESWGQGGRRGVQAGSVADRGSGPQGVVRTEDEIWGLQKWAWYPPREAEVDPVGWPEGVKAGHSEAWASEPADLARHWLGETEDVLEGCCAPSRSRERRPVDLDHRESPARLQGSWCSSAVSTRAHRNSEVMTAAGRNTTRICTGTRTAMRRRWRLSNLDRVGRPARLRGSKCSREASTTAHQVAAGERSAR